jgi:hypothetical protein
MADVPETAPTDTVPERGRSPRTPLRRILDENPEAGPRLRQAIAALLGAGLVTLATVGGLLIWHIMRRARLIRERLNPPRIVQPLEQPVDEVDPTS